jgi:hypothetical protein
MSRGPDESVGAVRKSPYKPIILLFLAATMTLYAQSGPAVRRADAQAATQVGRYRLQSNP